MNDVQTAVFDYSVIAWYSLPGAVFAALQIIGSWFAFQKAGRPGWAALIPFYNAYTYNKVGGRPGWWWILWYIPVVGLVITALVAVSIAKNFGKSAGWGIGLLWFLPFVGYLVLGFSPARYLGPHVWREAGAAPSAPPAAAA